MSIKTNKFTENLAKAFYNDFANNDYYLFGSDYNNEYQSTNNNYSKNIILEKTIFGKKILDDEFSYMIRNNVWTNGTVYTQYDDNTVDIRTYNFYVIVEPDTLEGGNYYVFKCLYNNNSSISTEKPSFNNSIYLDNGNYELSDGYIWKHVSTIPNSIAKKFGTRGYLPVVRDQFIEQNAVDGIEVILVENIDNNVGYEKISGNVLYTPTSGVITMTVNTQIQGVPSFYTGRSLYVEKGDGSPQIGARQYKILDSGKDTSDQFFVVVEGYDPNDFPIEIDDDCQILPYINIQGDGSGAEGIAVFDVTETKIISVKILERGSGYKNAIATVIDPISFTTETGNVRCELRPIISPTNGHGANIIEELRVSNVCFSAYIASGGTSTIPDTFTYSKVALVKNPIVTGLPNTFDNRIELLMSNTTGLNAGDAVYQTNGVEGIIHEVLSDRIYIINYNGPYNVTFDENLVLKTNNAGDFGINSINYSIYTQKSGDVLYMSDFSPIERKQTTIEQIKILVDF